MVSAPSIRQRNFTHQHLGSIRPRSASIDSCSTTVGDIASHDFEQAWSGQTRASYDTATLLGFFLQDVSKDGCLELELFLLAFCTGIIDAVTFSNYRVFCSKQTGNTIMIALGALGVSGTEHNAEYVILSLGSFVCSALVFGWAGNLLGPKRRLWLLLSNSVSTVFILAASVLLLFRDGGSTGLPAMGVIVFLASACGGQLQLALSIQMPELNTTMITAAVVNLVSDPKLLSLENSVRNRRVLYWASLLSGAFVGALAVKVYGPMLAISLAAIVKIFVGLLFMSNPGAVSDLSSDIATSRAEQDN